MFGEEACGLFQSLLFGLSCSLMASIETNPSISCWTEGDGILTP